MIDFIERSRDFCENSASVANNVNVQQRTLILRVFASCLSDKKRRLFRWSSAQLRSNWKAKQKEERAARWTVKISYVQQPSSSTKEGKREVRWSDETLPNLSIVSGISSSAEHVTGWWMEIFR